MVATQQLKMNKPRKIVMGQRMTSFNVKDLLDLQETSEPESRRPQTSTGVGCEGERGRADSRGEETRGHEARVHRRHASDSEDGFGSSPEIDPCDDSEPIDPLSLEDDMDAGSGVETPPELGEVTPGGAYYDQNNPYARWLQANEAYAGEFVTRYFTAIYFAWR